MRSWRWIGACSFTLLCQALFQEIGRSGVGANKTIRRSGFGGFPKICEHGLSSIVALATAHFSIRTPQFLAEVLLQESSSSSVNVTQEQVSLFFRRIVLKTAGVFK